MAFPITPFIDLCNSAICGYCSYRLYKSYRSEVSNRSVLYFAQGYLSLVFSYLFFAIPRLTVPENSYFIGVGFVVAQAFLYIALAFFIKVTVGLLNPLWIRRSFYAILAVSGMAVILSIIFFGYPNYDIATGITEWNIQPAVGWFSSAIFLCTLIPSGIFFLWRGSKSQDKEVKVRSIIIGTGLLLLTVTAYTYYTASTATAAFVSDILSLLTYVVIFIGIVYKQKNTSSITNNN